jgi:hypothetical protein
VKRRKKNREKKKKKKRSVQKTLPSCFSCRPVSKAFFERSKKEKKRKLLYVGRTAAEEPFFFFLKKKKKGKSGTRFDRTYSFRASRRNREKKRKKKNFFFFFFTGTFLLRKGGFAIFFVFLALFFAFYALRTDTKPFRADFRARFLLLLLLLLFEGRIEKRAQETRYAVATKEYENSVMRRVTVVSGEERGSLSRLLRRARGVFGIEGESF